MINHLTIIASDVPELLGLGYSTIEIWESTDFNNSFHEITSSAAKKATLSSISAGTLFEIGGSSIQFSLNNGAPIEVAFSSTILFWTPTQVVNQINTISPGTASLSTDNLSVLLQSPSTGRSQSIQIVFTTAVGLGFNTGDLAYGTDQRLALTNGAILYPYTDTAGQGLSTYKWRFSADGVNPLSQFSAPVSGSESPVIDPADLSIATATFVDSEGMASRTSVIVSSPNPPTNILSVSVGNFLPKVYTADDFGFVQIPMVKGLTVRVAIDGTDLIREFVVPNLDTFDLLTVMGTANDQFAIQVPTPLLTRRTV